MSAAWVAGMAAALEQARAAVSAGDLPYGAAVVDGAGTVVAVDRDRVVEHGDLTSHGELLVVRRAAAARGPDLTGCTLVSTVEPCAMCFSAAWTARITTVAFGLSMRELQALVPSSMDEIVLDSEQLNRLADRRLDIAAGVEHDACVRLWASVPRG